MNSPTNGAALLAQDAENTRHRQYQDVSRLLKEYTGVMYEIASQIAAYLDTPKNAERHASWPILGAVRRYRAIWEEVGALALFASQMLVHYQLDESEAAELRLRVADAECGIQSTGILINILCEDHSEAGDPIPPEELDALIQQIQVALKK